jgi:DNA-binding NarL/FixJ family response regulator
MEQHEETDSGVQPVRGPATASGQVLRLGARAMSTATDPTVELWPAAAHYPTLTLAVGAPSQAQARCLADVLEREGVLVAATFTSLGELALEPLARHLDAIVLAVSVNETDAERGVRQTRSAHYQAGIVVVCARSAERHLQRYLEEGADGVVFADELEVTLAAAVRCAAAGQISVPQSMRRLLAPPALSYRERQVLELAARGLTNRQIASSLFLAESTVKTHLSSAFRRLGVRSRREATALMRAAEDHMPQRLTVSPRAGRTTSIGARLEECGRRQGEQR